MELYANCMMCLLNGQLKDLPDDKKKQSFFKDIMKTIVESGKDACAPWLASQINKLYEKHYQDYVSYTNDKRKYNQFFLDLENEIEKKIFSLKDALIYARVGNYIDFSAVEQIDEQDFLNLLNRKEDFLDEKEYSNLCNELAHSQTLVYLLDNCGEIVLDKIVIKKIKKLYPHLEIVAICRGSEVMNDATIEDCKQVGLDQICMVIGNGNDCAGTILNQISLQAKTYIEKAEVIISKGQGNFESLSGCNLNIYYLFLCKCDWFMKKFNVERFTGMLLNEKRQIKK